MKGLTAPQQQAVSRHDGSAPAQAHILVVDDDKEMRELLALHLAGAGYQVSAAEDAVAAGHSVLEHLPDLIIADFKMPYMNGVEFIRAMRADVTIPDVPVIFMTALENASELAGRTFGFPLLTKPLHADKLLSTVADELRLYAARANHG